MTLLAVKVLLAPGFVVLASLAGRRFGARIGGMLGGLPVVAGPILLVYALSHGDRFASHASAATVLGLVSLMGFVIVYAWLAHHARRWWQSLLAGWAAFAAFTYLFSLVRVSAVLALIVMGIVLLSAPALLPRVAVTGGEEAQKLPSWDLPMRAVAALALVLTLTAAAGWLGPQVSGLLAPFPVIASVLAVFTHTQGGQAEALRLLRGLLLGYGPYALFCFLLALTLPSLGTTGSFLLATGVALLCQAAILWLRRASIARPRMAQPGRCPPVTERT